MDGWLVFHLWTTHIIESDVTLRVTQVVEISPSAKETIVFGFISSFELNAMPSIKTF